MNDYKYVSIFGRHTVGKRVQVSTSQISVGDSGEQQCGFVVKVFDGSGYSEYAFSDITKKNFDSIVEEVKTKTKVAAKLKKNRVKLKCLPDEPLVRDFKRPAVGKKFTIPEIIDRLTAMRDKVKAGSDKLVFVAAGCQYYDISSMFISPNRDLTQEYGWSMVLAAAVARDENSMQQAREIAPYNSLEECFAVIEGKLDTVAKTAEELLKAKPIEPGEYDIITAPSITGLIAHEAFGHGVEMDMFVKKRAKSRKYLNKQVASKLINMHDGAAATQSCVGYFFDDEGVLAHDTLIIKEGILQTGISDSLSALQLGTECTGNGRRQEPSHKAYTRMTNTFFEPGTDNVDEMIKSVKHGYMLFNTDNGMEDPKGWNIQCTAQYGKEIKNGKFTGKIVAPVVMSGYVPDLLKSISMVSEEWEVIGAGYCGKGHKEWVPVSDGGPYLKARCKLG